MKVLALLLVLSAVSCKKHVDLALPSAEVPENASFTIKIVNNNRLDVVLYVVHDSHRERLGQATASTTASFEFRLRRLGAGREFRLEADPVGSPNPVRTESFLARDAMILTWTLETDFRRSNVTVF